MSYIPPQGGGIVFPLQQGYIAPSGGGLVFNLDGVTYQPDAVGEGGGLYSLLGTGDGVSGFVGASSAVFAIVGDAHGGTTAAGAVAEAFELFGVASGEYTPFIWRGVGRGRVLFFGQALSTQVSGEGYCTFVLGGHGDGAHPTQHTGVANGTAAQLLGAVQGSVGISGHAGVAWQLLGGFGFGSALAPIADRSGAGYGVFILGGGGAFYHGISGHGTESAPSFSGAASGSHQSSHVGAGLGALAFGGNGAAIFGETLSADSYVVKLTGVFCYTKSKKADVHVVH